MIPAVCDDAKGPEEKTNGLFERDFTWTAKNESWATLVIRYGLLPLALVLGAYPRNRRVPPTRRPFPTRPTTRSRTYTPRHVGEREFL